MDLTLEGNLSDISFCDKQCKNVRNNEFKGKMINYIEKRYNIDIISRLYNRLQPKTLRNVSFNQHILATLNGNPYLLFLTQIDDINCCFFIDRKLKDGYEYPKIHFVSYKFHSSLFNDTIFSGELIRDTKKRWCFMLSDLLICKGNTEKYVISD